MGVFLAPKMALRLASSAHKGQAPARSSAAEASRATGIPASGRPDKRDRRRSGDREGSAQRRSCPIGVHYCSFFCSSLVVVFEPAGRRGRARRIWETGRSGSMKGARQSCPPREIPTSTGCRSSNAVLEEPGVSRVWTRCNALPVTSLHVCVSRRRRAVRTAHPNANAQAGAQPPASPLVAA